MAIVQALMAFVGRSLCSWWRGWHLDSTGVYDAAYSSEGQQWLHKHRNIVGQPLWPFRPIDRGLHKGHMPMTGSKDKAPKR